MLLNSEVRENADVEMTYNAKKDIQRIINLLILVYISVCFLIGARLNSSITCTGARFSRSSLIMDFWHNSGVPLWVIGIVGITTINSRP